MGGISVHSEDIASYQTEPAYSHLQTEVDLHNKERIKEPCRDVVSKMHATINDEEEAEQVQKE